MQAPDDEQDAQNFAASRPEFVFDDDENDSDDREDLAEQVTENDEDADAGADDSVNEIPTLSNKADLYALLGLAPVPPPSDADIRGAYHRISAQFHPDKHPPTHQNAARQQFERVQNAYEILIDATKRVIYDLVGEDGVTREYAPGGAMRSGPCEQTKEIGPKAMSPQEFRKWFIAQMKKRERKELQSLVESRTNITLGLDSQSVFPPKDGTTSFALRVPSIRPTRFALRTSFKVPFPTLYDQGTIDATGSPQPSSEDSKDDDSYDDALSANKVSGHLMINASVGGQLKQSQYEVKFRDIKTNEITPKMIPLPPSILARSLALGTTAFISVPEAGRHDGKYGLFRSVRHFFDGSELEIGTHLFPQPSSRMTLSRAFTPLDGAKPFLFRAQAFQNLNSVHMPPIVGLTLSRQLGSRHAIFCSWSSGTLFWPFALRALLAPIIALGPDPNTASVIDFQYSSFSLGLNGSSMPSISQESFDSDSGQKQASHGSWGVEIGTNAHGSSLSVAYGRNVFRGQVPGPKLSEWTDEGRRRQESASDLLAIERINAVRLEVQLSINSDGAFVWSVGGNRRFGDFTRAGISIGVQGPRGLVLNFTWNRLGQSLTVPVAVCPVSLVDVDIAAAAVGIPWLAYGILHYALLKPRAGRRRKEALKRRREEVEKAVRRRKQESLTTIELMKPAVERRQQKEDVNGGLVIETAMYGPVIPNLKRTTPSNDLKCHVADVTIPVAALVHHGQLSIPKALNKGQLIGFYDPAPNRPKVLQLRYRYGGKEHYAEFVDDQDVLCPNREHTI